MDFRIRILSMLLVFLTLNGIAHAGSLTGIVNSNRLRNNSNVVVCLKPIVKFAVKLPAVNPVMDQWRLEFLPHIMVVPVGTTVDFLNSDQTKHNIFSPDKVADKFDFGYYGPGEKRSHTFTKAGSAVLLCNKHVEMEAYVYVCDSPLYSITDKKGNYLIEGIPPGNYAVKIWHKKLKPHLRDISIKEGIIEFNIELDR